MFDSMVGKENDVHRLLSTVYDAILYEDDNPQLIKHEPYPSIAEKVDGVLRTSLEGKVILPKVPSQQKAEPLASTLIIYAKPAKKLLKMLATGGSGSGQ